jgi:hypothetical protein
MCMPRRIVLAAAVIVLSSCSVGSYDTSDWPTIPVAFTASEMPRVDLRLIDTENGTDESNDITDGETLQDFYTQLDGSFPHQEAETKQYDVNDYWQKCDVSVTLTDDDYDLTYYGYAVSDGILILNDGTAHFVPGDFVSCFWRRYQ